MVNGVLSNVLGVFPSTIKLAAIRKFKRYFYKNVPVRSTLRPDRKGIEAWVKRFEAFGIVENLNKKSDRQESHSGRKRVRDEVIIERVRDDVKNSPKRDLRKRAQLLRICYSTLRRVVKEDLGKFLYHIQTKHMLSADDKRRRQVMARALLPMIETKPLFLEWASHSPDLSPPDFFLWGYLKDRVYQEKPRSLIALKKKVRDDIKAIKPEMLKRFMTNFHE